jgi:predicted RNA-binding Zn-ribbon protein involved in translation (DUF1610 family)
MGLFDKLLGKYCPICCKRVRAETAGRGFFCPECGNFIHTDISWREDTAEDEVNASPEEMAERNARDLIAESGDVEEVRLKTDGGIEVLFASGRTVTLGSGYRFGYRGTGPTCFAVWLRASGFRVTDEQVAAMKAPMKLRGDENS